MGSVMLAFSLSHLSSALKRSQMCLEEVKCCSKTEVDQGEQDVQPETRSKRVGEQNQDKQSSSRQIYSIKYGGILSKKEKKKGQIWGYGGKRTLDIRHTYNSTSLISLERCQASLRSKGVQLSDLQQVQSPRRKLFCKSGCFLINLVYKDKLFLTVRMITRLGFFFSNTDEQ